MLVYVHVPFCGRRCTYCDFAIAVRSRTPGDEFVGAVLAEWRARQDWPGWAESPAVESVYFGGGTPSRLEPAAIGTLLEGLRAARPMAAGAEVTLEANPEDVTPARAEGWRTAGVNRVSLGVQSFDPGVLAWMHRSHSGPDAERAVDRLRQAGFANLSLDLIYGLPADLGRDWEADLERALALAPEHLSLYALTVEGGTPLGKWTARREVVPRDDDAVAREYLHAHGRLGERGYHHYEVSNAARPGYRAVHNSGYWTGTPCLGLGPSAASAAGRWRGWNVREWEAWRRAIAAGGPTLAGAEHLAPDQQALERQYLGLRTDAGLARGEIPPALLAAWQAAGWADDLGGRVRLTAEGWLRLDALVAALPVP